MNKKILMLTKIITLALIFIALKKYVLNAIDYQDIILSIKNSGAKGVIVFASLYIISSLFFLPGSILTLAAGFIYGPMLGTLLVSPVSVLAAIISFLLTRTLLKNYIEKKIKDFPKLQAMLQAISKDGFKMIFLLRLSPVFPFNVLNYALGLTNVSLKNYALASFLGMLPGTLLYVYIGSLAFNILDLSSGGTKTAGQTVFTIVGFVLTLVTTVYISKKTKKILEENNHA